MPSSVRSRPALAALAALASLGALAVRPAAAQRPVRVALSVGGTVAAPVGDATGGLNAQLSALLGRPTGRLGLRADLAYFGAGRSTLGGQISPRADVYSLSLNGVVNLRPASARVRPYLIGGLGAYNSGLEAGRSWSAGANAGLGTTVRVGGRELFAEARLHTLADSYPGSFLPLSLGVRF